MYTYEWSDWRNGMFWWIQSVYVLPEARRGGVFRALFRHVEQLAERDAGVCGIRLYVERENTRAQATYRHCGMHDAGYAVMELDYTSAAAAAEGDHHAG
jgi:ribosomal protein S18 acetylase RimI-like enzyme